MLTARHQCTASLFGAHCGTALMMRREKDRSVTERFVAACCGLHSLMKLLL